MAEYLGNNNGWDEWRNHVLQEQKRQGRVLDQLMNDLQNFRLYISTEVRQVKTEVKIKSGVWGAIAGLIPSSIVVAYVIIKSII